MWWRKRDGRLQGHGQPSIEGNNGTDSVAQSDRGRSSKLEGRGDFVHISSSSGELYSQRVSSATPVETGTTASASRREASFPDSILDLAASSVSSSLDDEDAYAQAAYQDYFDGEEEEPDVYDVDLDLPPSPTRLRAMPSGSMNGNRPAQFLAPPITTTTRSRETSNPAPSPFHVPSHPYRQPELPTIRASRPSPRTPYASKPRITDPIPPRISSLTLADLPARSARPSPRTPLLLTPSPQRVDESIDSGALAGFPARALAAAAENGIRAKTKRFPVGGSPRSGTLGASSTLGRGEAQVSVNGVEVQVVAL